ncbi:MULTISPECIES: DUF4266 domain-containing protein [Colwellia]|uniref:DUF4266 domain-containing protein n=1 Tax=Colwellia marinimaniae TaxID=1513592 RepID=A0ABQ0MXK4_9GAMM|nr:MULTISPECIES: DUF4266 domain-containing protein [Colwellia]GAW97096.1 hypothetical protein MTCD1_02722 [Colwellia marinimaniae]
MLSSIKATKNLAIILACFVCTACSTIEAVKPWQKATLAQETMRFGGPNPMIKKFDEHIYTSKEATKGGGGVSGGGCGCN